MLTREKSGLIGDELVSAAFERSASRQHCVTADTYEFGQLEAPIRKMNRNQRRLLWGRLVGRSFSADESCTREPAQGTISRQAGGLGFRQTR
jgi:hypothetical protein